MKVNEVKSALTDKEFEVLETMYSRATTRKTYILLLLTVLAVTVLNSLVSLSMDSLIDGWMTFIGAGISVIVFGVVAVYALMNDSVYDIVTSIRPDLNQED